MPVIELKVIKEYEERVVYIAKELIKITTEVLRKDSSVTVVELSIIETITNSENSRCGFNLNIKITEGTNTEKEKSLWIKTTNCFLKKKLGLEEYQNLNYISIQEIPSGLWGYDGSTQRFRKNNKE